MATTNELIHSPRVHALYARLVAAGQRTRGSVVRPDGSFALLVVDASGKPVGRCGRFRERRIASAIHFALCRIHRHPQLAKAAAPKPLAPRAEMPSPVALATARARLAELDTSVVGTTKLAEGNYALRLANGDVGPGFATRSLATRVWKALSA